jgi:hypothetical protein|tara:strand:+ start:1132 stop:1377 length:246 start_codon:yes stop_codon:yes gene_type:complete
MDSPHIVLFGTFAVVAYFILTDENVAAAFVYVLKLVSTNIRRHWWWLLNNPKNPVVKYFIYRHSMHLAKELVEEINKNKHT